MMSSNRPRAGRLSLSSLSARIAAGLFALGAGSPALAAAADFGPTNPFYAPSTLPFQAPPFDRIKDEDFQPAIEAGMAQQKAEILSIASNPDAPTFANTILAMEKSGRLLARVAKVFDGVAGANINPTLQQVQAIEAPKRAAHRDFILLNGELFARVAAIYEQRAKVDLDPESRRLVEYDYHEFVHAGANLSAADKAELRKLNEEEASLADTFIAKVLEATKAGAYATGDKAALAGFSAPRMAAAALAAKSRQKDGFVIPLQNTTQQPDLASLSDRATRQTIFERSWNRTERGDANDTRDTIARLAQLRARKARLLGYSSFAAWTLEDQMVRTPQAALGFMDALVPAATAKAASEARDNQGVIDAQNGGFQLQPWDWSFYAEQVRKARYDLDDAQVKPYFDAANVLQHGVFYAATLLYGLTFKPRYDIPVYHPDVRVFEVSDADGKPLGLFYCDYFKRDNKSGGAWSTTLVDRSRLLGTHPVVYLVANFTKPAAGEPALIGFKDVITLFQQFGHTLRAMFDDVAYPSLSGAATARDFIEFPSQLNGHWASEPMVFAHYATHYKTGEPMPEELAARVRRASTFNAGFDMTEVLAAAELDMQWHSLAPTAPLQNPDEVEREALDKSHLNVGYVPPRYRSTYFNHIWLVGGFSAGFYAYLWTEMLADDAYQWFVERGGPTRANGDRFRQMVLARGNTEDLARMYELWRGAPPNPKAMLKYRGLDDATMKKAR
jgi:peptidyl-dipeptidase Dcp